MSGVLLGSILSAMSTGFGRYQSCSFKIQSHIDSGTRFWHLPLVL